MRHKTLLSEMAELRTTNRICSTTLLNLRERSGATTQEWNEAITQKKVEVLNYQPPHVIKNWRDRKTFVPDKREG